jgi:hypothetical protein
VKVASERDGRGVLHAPLLHEAGITCSLSTYESNDEVITPTSEQIQDMRWWEWAIMEIQSCVSGYDGNSKSFQNPRSTLITPEMASLCSATQVQSRYSRPTPSNQAEVAYHKLFPKHSRCFHLIQHRVEAQTAFSSAEPQFD